MKTKKRWIPEIGQFYYYVSLDGSNPKVVSYYRMNLTKKSEFKYVYKTKKEAMAARKKILQILKAN